MTRCLPLPLVCLAAAVAARAGPLESAIVATMRLSEQPNYSWSTTVTDDARTYDIHGATVRGGFTRVKMPVVNSVRRRLGRSATDTEAELIFRGNVHCVIATEQGWRKPADLPPPPDENEALSPHPGATVALFPAGITGAMNPNARTAPRPPREERHYSNLQLTLSHPHEELAVIVSSHERIEVEGDIVTGTLTALGAQLLLVHDGQNELTPVNAAGSFKLWLRDGIVAKYQLRLEGRLEVDTPKGRRQIDVHQTSETIVTNVGTTSFQVPAQAQMQLGP